MILIINHVKMTTNRQCISDLQTEDEGETFLHQVSRAVHNRQMKTQRMMDIIIAIISVPLLVIFSFMLQQHMRSDWLHNVETRWRILGLGLSLLFISLVVCLYVTHRLGLCIWAAQQQRDIRQNTEICRRVPNRPSNCPPLTTTGNQLQLMVGGELPPSYDSIMRNSEYPPPSYFSVLLCDEKNQILPAIHNKAPSIHQVSTELDFGSRPLETSEAQNHQLVTASTTT